MQNSDNFLANIDKKEYSKQELVSLLKLENSNALTALFKFANEQRKMFNGNNISISSLIQFSNYCSKNCLYCGLRRANYKIQRYSLNPDEIIKLAIESEKNNFKSITLESGDDEELKLTDIVGIIKEIKRNTGLSISLNIGEKTEEEYAELKKAGCDKYILSHKTSDPILYRQLHSDLKYSNRIKLLKVLKSQKFQVQSGIFVGLPGQTFESIANDILLFKELEVDTIEISPYLPDPNTPLSKKFDQIGGYFAPAVGYFNIEDLIYKIIAITKLVNKKSNILVSQLTAPNIDSLALFKASLEVGVNNIIMNMFEVELLEYTNSSAKLNLSRDSQFLLKQLKTIAGSTRRNII